MQKLTFIFIVLCVLMVISIINIWTGFLWTSYHAFGESMGENKEGIVICIKPINYKVGDVIIYDPKEVNWTWCPFDTINHRIIDIQDGCYIMKGDANNNTDPISCLTKDKIICKVIIRIPVKND